MKGRSVQYHSNISKDEGRIFYEKFTTLCEVFYFYIKEVECGAMDLCRACHWYGRNILG